MHTAYQTNAGLPGLVDNNHLSFILNHSKDTAPVAFPKSYAPKLPQITKSVKSKKVTLKASSGYIPNTTNYEL
jgi:hypothetical protein